MTAGMRALVHVARRLVIACALAGIGASAVSLAQQVEPGLPPPPADVVAAKAYGVLERSCARCHQSGLLEGSPPGGGIANILDLEAVAREPSLVRPGVPDASRLYNVALVHERHLDHFNDPASAPPSALEVQAVRDWIMELGVKEAGPSCAGRARMSGQEVAAAIARTLQGLPPERARQMRFLSFAHLHNACLADADLAALRSGVGDILSALAPAGAAIPAGGWAQAVDGRGLVLAVSLTSIGWRPQTWSTLAEEFPLRDLPSDLLPSSAARATGTALAVLHADWFAQAVLSKGLAARAEGGGARVWGLAAPQALAHAWRRPLTLDRLVADLGLSRHQEISRMRGFSQISGSLAWLQLGGGAVARREEVDAMLALLAGRPEPPISAEKGGEAEIGLAADQPVYRAGDTAKFAVMTTRDCWLTLVGVDRAGRATVLFPNELAPDNRISPGVRVEIPAAGAPYRFRFKDKGHETIVAICSQTQKSPDGIAHDYDRLRFTVLGDWQLFLREPPEMKEARRDDAATDVPRPQARPRRRGRGAETSAPTAAQKGADVQTRTAITVVVE